MQRLISFRLTLLAGLATSLPALAQPTAQPAVPPALQQNPVERLTPVEPPRLSPSISAPPIVPQTGPGAAAVVRLGAVTVQGNTALPTATLRAALALREGEAVSLAQVEEARLDMLRAYRDAGFPFAAIAAGLTPRGNGVADLSFSITEGFVSEVRLEGDIGPAGTQVLRFLERVRDTTPVTAAAIERALLLASDIPGITVRGVLRPLPDRAGALQLVAQVERKSYSGYFNLDNRGYKLSGAWQGLLVAGLNAFTELGERTELALFGGEANNQNFLQGSFEAFVGGSGLRVRLYAGAGRARPGSTLSQLGYRGDTQVGGIATFYPLVRSRPFNLYAVGQFDVFDSTVDQGKPDRTQQSRDAIRVLRGGLDAQFLDSVVPFLPTATTTAGFRLHQGLEIFGATRSGRTSGAGPSSPARNGSEFDFRKISGEIQRTQPLFSPFDGGLISLQGLVQGQYSADVLPTAEKFYLGGARLGRGFYAGQVTGDSAFGFAAELQLDVALPTIELPYVGWTLQPTPQLYAFRDVGRSFESTRNDFNRKLSSWGGGLRLPLNESLQFDVEGVKRISRQPTGAAADPLNETAVFFRTLVRF
ncbi:ShlB/FhaC/HecB family hemolysin secretion/activation protein [Roseomonas sp. BN140053]|uniref:ShlB/FhaC/HecB family hemolysin secretion/activation protein n=1 Tax=Roseomonas sp. BN140053 TaxID=3391898 RepID=UPI0039E7324A